MGKVNNLKTKVVKIKSFFTGTKKVEDVVPEITPEKDIVEATPDIIEPTETIEQKEIESIEVDSIISEENGDMTIIKGEEQFIVPAEAIVNLKPEVVEQVINADIEPIVVPEVTKVTKVTEVTEKPVVEPEFNEAKYLAANPDVAEALLYNRIISAYGHYIEYGKAEGRTW